MSRPRFNTPDLRSSLGLGARFGKRINRAPSPFVATALPWLTIMLGSVAPSWIFIVSAPLVPPFGLLLLIAWRQLRPGLLAVWAGLPLGLFDDLYSGQPLGSAVMLWSLAIIALDIIEARLPWRNFLTEWLVASGLVTSYAILGLGIANLAGGATPLATIVPQIIVAIFVYPLIGRLVALFDRARLTPFREIR